MKGTPLKLSLPFPTPLLSVSSALSPPDMSPYSPDQPCHPTSATAAAAAGEGIAAVAGPPPACPHKHRFSPPGRCRCAGGVPSSKKLSSGSLSSCSTSSDILLARISPSSYSPSDVSSASPSDSCSLSSCKSLGSSSLPDRGEEASEATSPRIPRFSSFSRLKHTSSGPGTGPDQAPPTPRPNPGDSAPDQPPCTLHFDPDDPADEPAEEFLSGLTPRQPKLSIFSRGPALPALGLCLRAGCKGQGGVPCPGTTCRSGGGREVAKQRTAQVGNEEGSAAAALPSSFREGRTEKDAFESRRGKQRRCPEVDGRGVDSPGAEDAVGVASPWQVGPTAPVSKLEAAADHPPRVPLPSRPFSRNQIHRAPSCESGHAERVQPRRWRRRRGVSFSEEILPLENDACSPVPRPNEDCPITINQHSVAFSKGSSSMGSSSRSFDSFRVVGPTGGASACSSAALLGSSDVETGRNFTRVDSEEVQGQAHEAVLGGAPVVGPGRTFEWSCKSPEAREPSPEPAAPSGQRVPRLPSLSRLNLSSKESEGFCAVHLPSLKCLPLPLVTSIGGFGTPPGGSPERKRLGRHSSAPACLKRKRPPMLDIPMKDSFTASPASTPPGFDEAAEEVKEMSAAGPGYAALCRRGKRREVVEDRFQAVQNLSVDSHSDLAFFGVYDGHGGTAAAEFAAQELHLSLLASLRRRQFSDMEAAMVDAFLETDKKFLAQDCPSGASCVACLVSGNEVVIGHAGDCRAVMWQGRKAVPLTDDHKASREDERERIEAVGGHVDDFTGTWRVQGIMAVTRGIGDAHLKEYISPEPETCRVEVESDDDFIVLASDGLWDVVSSEEAVDVVSSLLYPAPVPCSAKGRSASVRTQIDAILSPLALSVEPPSVPLPKKGFRCSSLSAVLNVSGGAGVAADREKGEQAGSSVCAAELRAARVSEPRLAPEEECLRQACLTLADLALKRGSSDDICVMVVRPSVLVSVSGVLS